VYIPKWANLALQLLGAAVLGWLLHMSVGNESAHSAPENAAATDGGILPRTAPTPSVPTDADAAPEPTPIYLTVVMPDGTTVGGDGSAAQSQPVPVPTSWRPARGAPPPEPVPSHTEDGPTEINAPGPVSGMSIIANGDGIIIATNGSIIAAGDNPNVRGNTGDAGSSGTIAVDAVESQISSGDSQVSRGAAPGAGTAATDDPAAAPPSAATTTGAPGNGAPTLAERAVAISGWADNTLDVSGDDNILTYDDSNVVVDRIGNHNGNTGDTDTSGLNVVDAAGSVVRSGSSQSAETPEPAGTSAPASSTATPPPWASNASVAVADANGVATATGADSLVIGAGGVDLNGVRVRGERNIATYDDGNVAVGGIGDVNAQIGDSNTSGAVVMGIRDSYVESGSSYATAWPRTATADVAMAPGR
jgi:hypothetical protein